MFYMRFHRPTRTLRYASAGHPSVILLRRLSDEPEWLDADGLILGVQDEVVFDEKTLDLAEGDRLVLYTDGVIETQDPQGEFYGVERLAEATVRFRQLEPEAAVRSFVDSINQFRGQDESEDDVTLVVFDVMQES
jgi:sigma-B regulation protein RsbU (phosphoserine phosphatase)